MGTPERMYLTCWIPYGQVTRDVLHPGGEVLAPYSLRKGPGLRLHLAHDGGQLPTCRIPAARLHDSWHDENGLTLVFEAFHTAEGRRAVENCRESTPHVSPEFVVVSETTGSQGERIVTDAILCGVALVADAAYSSARVTDVQTATQRRRLRGAHVAATLAHAGGTPAPARQLPPAPDLAAAATYAQRSAISDLADRATVQQVGRAWREWQDSLAHA